MERHLSTGNISAIVLPLILLTSTMIGFSFFSKRFGNRAGYLAGFVFYWVFWCCTVPIHYLTLKGIIALFNYDGQLFKEHLVSNVACLLLPLIFAYAYAFPKALSKATFAIVAGSFLLAFVNATLEEILWRGTYLTLAGNNQLVYMLLSSLGFALWHFAPQLIHPSKAAGGQLSFVLFAFFLGLAYSTVTYQTKSILLVCASHMLFDFSGLGARTFLSKE